MSFTQILSTQSEWTWNVIGNGVPFDLVPSEETLTDSNLLSIALGTNGQFALTTVRFNKSQESQNGADWEWVFINKTSQFVTLLIQAKKLYPTTDKYEALGKTETAMQQCETLISSASTLLATPLYVLYNYTANPPKDVTIAALGCRVSPASTIKNQIAAKAYSFKEIYPISSPWTEIYGSDSSEETTSVVQTMATSMRRLGFPVHVQSQPHQYILDLLHGVPVSSVPSGASTVVIFQER